VDAAVVQKALLNQRYISPVTSVIYRLQENRREREREKCHIYSLFEVLSRLEELRPVRTDVSEEYRLHHQGENN
jgi:hypothetical protein